MSKYVELKELLGKTMSSVKQHGNDEIVFVTTGGEQYRLFHNQSCCESVTIESVTGDLADLVGTPILIAEVVTSNKNPKDVPSTESEDEWDERSFTWTFYKFATVKGYVDIRWYGSSNGYYSESVDFEKCGPDDEGEDE